MVLDSSPLADDPQAREFAKSIYAKPNWFELSSSGEAFRPIEGNTGSAAASAFIRSDAANLYLAVFNYDDKNPATVQVPIARIVSPAQSGTIVEAIDTVSGAHESFASGSISVTLRAAESKLLLLKNGQKP
jgi:outer membrane receptor for ferric coprogen and ferric-rhodotorulic acid